MNYFRRFFALILTLILLQAALPVFARATQRTPAGSIAGMIVRSRSNADFPSAPNQSAKAMRTQLDELTDYAVQSGYNAIFFEARPEGSALYSSKYFPTSRFQVRKQGDFTFFDPLRELCRTASKKGLAVYALVDPYSLGMPAETGALSAKHPAAQNPALALPVGESLLLNPRHSDTIRLNARDIGTMVKKYDLAGVILENLYPTGGMEDAAASLLENVSAAVDGRTVLGVLLEDTLLEGHDLTGLMPYVKLVLPVISAPAGFDGAGYGERLSAWRQQSAADLIPVLEATRIQSFTGELADKRFVASQSGVESFAVDGYHALRYGEYEQGNLLASLKNPSETVFTPLHYAPAQTLAVTRPAESLATDFSSYFIMGTSDPARPLTLDWKPVERQTEDGLFGVLVPLAVGNNAFVLRQGGDAVTVRIRRFLGGGGGGVTDRISSAWPVSSGIAREGEELTLSCVAPAGSHVTAHIGGLTVPMVQKSAAAAAAVPAVFTGKLTLSGGTTGSVKRIGAVTYTLTHNQVTSTISSDGDVFLCGDGAEPWLRVTDHAASVFYDDKVEEGKYKAVYMAGITERILGQTGEYYQLASTGYIKKAAVEVLESDAPRAVTIERISAEHTDRAERFVLHGAEGLPYSFVDRDDGSISLTLYGRLSLPEQVDVQSSLFSSIRWLQNPDGSLTCELTPADPKALWGIDVFPQEGATVLYAKRAPTLSATVGKPLEGVSIVLDPGHGGVDPGALGVLGVDGPTEKEINFAAATILKQRLEQLGAKVLLSRAGNDDTRSLYERMELAHNELPDFFLAIHHNSVVESVDGYQNSGVEAYYYAPFGKNLSEAIIDAVSADNANRPRRTSELSYYTVTRMRYAPSVLAELGFLPNPVEYRQICDTTEIYKTANAIAAAFLRVIKQAA